MSCGGQQPNRRAQNSPTLASPHRRRAVSEAGDPPSLPVLPDEVLGDIFLCLEAANDLARVSSACKSFRRVVCDPQFLRRFRFLHPPPVLGFFGSWESGGFHHAEPPHRSASAARAIAQATDFACSFLPNPGTWKIRDASDGRLLLCSRPADTKTAFMDLVVCDPLHRRYVRIPPIPKDLASSSCLGPLSLLAASGVEEEESPLGVICMDKQLGGKVSAFVFSSATGKWRGITFEGWRGNGGVILTCCRYYAPRSLCWKSEAFSCVFMLDACKMEFSVVRIRRPLHYRQCAIVEAEEGRLGLLTLDGCILDLYCKAREDNGVGSEEWKHERTIPLPNSGEYAFGFSGAGEGYILLEAIPLGFASTLQCRVGLHYFILKLKTFLVERLCVSGRHIDSACLYANFLPPLSLPVV
ncbi:hypothetical protein BS78_K178400 [Paspalum vaginatum]|uniref:F-box domain-containing protein n=1 Tax=Paspalum vaginatum TaxID=158149 RepID=A0A9W7XBL9_9POAL|nr:hypothetical protein BS78_K178400 [Paspalum vaginatum]